MNKNTIPTPAQIAEMYDIINILSDKYNNKSSRDCCYSTTLNICNDMINVGDLFVSLCVSKHFKDTETGEDKCELVENIYGSSFYITADEMISRMRESITRADKVA